MTRRILTLILALGVLALAGPALAERPSDLAAYRQEALRLVNASRADHGLPPLDLTEPLNRAAQSHAEDMLRRGYFAHRSPEGRSVGDRFHDAGGSEWKLVEENIATCENCDLDPRRIERMQQGWMQSPSHRENILRRGLAGFGFGVAAGGGRVYAVQTFSGPGVPRTGDERAQSERLNSGHRTTRFLDLVNASRRKAGLQPLELNSALSTAAERLMPPTDAGPGAGLKGDIMAALPQDQRHEWRTLSVVSASCGGCGARPTVADLEYFAGQWLGDRRHGQPLLRPDMTHLGFALRATGQGRKDAVAVIGRHR